MMPLEYKKAYHGYRHLPQSQADWRAVRILKLQIGLGDERDVVVRRFEDVSRAVSNVYHLEMANAEDVDVPE